MLHTIEFRVLYQRRRCYGLHQGIKKIIGIKAGHDGENDKEKASRSFLNRRSELDYLLRSIALIVYICQDMLYELYLYYIQLHVQLPHMSLRYNNHGNTGRTT